MKFHLSQKNLKLIICFEIFSFILALIGILLLYIHLKFYIDRFLYNMGIRIFQAGLVAGICSFCFGVFFNGVQKNLIK